MSGTGSLTYRVFDLTIRTNLPIPGLPAVDVSAPAPDINAYWGLSPEREGRIVPGREEIVYESSARSASGEPALRMRRLLKSGFLRIEYNDGIRFWVDSKGTEVWSDWPPKLSIEDMATYFVGPVLGFLLRLRGVICLHGSAVSFEDRAIAFVGPSGSGSRLPLLLLRLKTSAYCPTMWWRWWNEKGPSLFFPHIRIYLYGRSRSSCFTGVSCRCPNSSRVGRSGALH